MTGRKRHELVHLLAPSGYDSLSRFPCSPSLLARCRCLALHVSPLSPCLCLCPPLRRLWRHSHSDLSPACAFSSLRFSALHCRSSGCLACASAAGMSASDTLGGVRLRDSFPSSAFGDRLPRQVSSALSTFVSVSVSVSVSLPLPLSLYLCLCSLYLRLRLRSLSLSLSMQDAELRVVFGPPPPVEPPAL